MVGTGTELESWAEQVKGVAPGFPYKTRSVCAHFPFNVVVQEDASCVEI